VLVQVEYENVKCDEKNKRSRRNDVQGCLTTGTAIVQKCGYQANKKEPAQ
jgi:hypothetical protein